MGVAALPKHIVYVTTAAAAVGHCHCQSTSSTALLLLLLHLKPLHIDGALDHIKPLSVFVDGHRGEPVLTDGPVQRRADDHHQRPADGGGAQQAGRVSAQVVDGDQVGHA